MRISTNNVKKDLPVAKMRRTVQMVKGLRAGLNGFQEIESKAAKAFLRWNFPPLTWYALFLTQHIPMFVNKRRFKVLDKAYRKVHDGIARVTPHRGYAWVLLQRRRSKLPPFIWINTHMINRKANHPELWREHWDALEAFVAYQVAKGRSCFITGDLNQTSIEKIHPRARVVAHHHLDYVIFVPAEGGVQLEELADPVVVDTPSDHHSLVAVLGLRVPKTR